MTLAGLPVDTLSTQNALIVSNARRWPLMIDPQLQANKWIRKLEEQAGLMVVTLSDADVMRKIETAVEHGRPVLIEGVGEHIEPFLEPLLLRQVWHRCRRSSRGKLHQCVLLRRSLRRSS